MNKACLFIGLCSLALSVQAQWLAPSTDTLSLNAAYVETVHNIPEASMTVKVFHTMPIDAPGLNPWFLHLAVVNEDNNTWNVYPLANVSDYQILPSAQTGYLKIALSKDDYNTQTGKPFQRKSLLFINLGNAKRSNGKIEIEEK